MMATTAMRLAIDTLDQYLITLVELLKWADRQGTNWQEDRYFRYSW
jgi:hypothetical protein